MNKIPTLISVTRSSIRIMPCSGSDDYSLPFSVVELPVGELDIKLLFKGKHWRLVVNDEKYGKVKGLVPGDSTHSWHITYRTGTNLLRTVTQAGWRHQVDNNFIIVAVNPAGHPVITHGGPNGLSMEDGNGNLRLKLGVL